MNSVFSSLFPEDLFGKPYESNSEYIQDLIKRADMMIMYYLSCVSSKDEKKSLDRFRGLIITTEQVERAININEAILENREFVKKDLSKADFFIKSRIKDLLAEREFFSVEYIRHVFELTDFELFYLILCVMPHVDDKYESIFGYLQDNINKIYPEWDIAFKLYYFVSDISEIENFYEIKSKSMTKMNSLIFEKDTFKVDSAVLDFVLLNGGSQNTPFSVDVYLPKGKKELPIMEGIANKISNIVYDYGKEENIFFYLYGPSGIGKKTQVKRFTELAGTACVFLDLDQLEFEDSANFYNTILIACRLVTINQGILCLYNFDSLLSETEEKIKYVELIFKIVKKFSPIIFVLSSKQLQDRRFTNDKLWIDVSIDYPEKEESIKFWEHCLSEISISENVKAFEMANKFTFTPGQIVGTIEEAKKFMIWNKLDTIEKKDLCSCAYTQIIHDLKKKATLIQAKYDWSQLVLAKPEKEMLKNACDQIRYKHIVYDMWGFNKRLAYGRGVSMLFAGPPGTGKTMAAQVVANDLDIEIYKVDLSQIVSKYIGETEKNLNDLFNEAKKSNVILFFDETDALLGKRTEVKDSHDKNANLETSYLLQKMEEYDGITIMSTNYMENIDQAFFRRISYVIHFPFPDVKARKEIWQKMFPKQVPLSDEIDFDYLANQFEISGGNIKNIAVTAAFLAAKTNDKLRMVHILTAVKYELTKQGKTLLKEDFGEHGYLFKK